MKSDKKFPGSREARKFLVDLTAEAGLDILPPEVREKVIGELALRLDAKLTIAALEALPEGKVAEFKELLIKRQSASRISKFLDKNVANIGQVYSLALANFRRVYLGK